MPDLEIIIPVLNEQDSIKELVQRIDKALSSAKIKYGIVFVDDGSSDFTVNRIKRLSTKYPITLHLKEGQRGKAYSILEGVKKTKSRTLAMIDGDLQYPPEVLPEMYKLSGQHAVVVANRKKDDISLLRRVGSLLSTGLVGRVILGLNCDAQSGLKIFKREIIQKLEPKDIKPWALDMPLLYTAIQMGETIGGVEIIFKKRPNGASKVKFFKTALEITTTALKLRIKKPRTFSTLPSKGGMLGAGVLHNKKRYITHTSLPHRSSAVVTFATWQKWLVLSLAAVVLIGLTLNFIATLVIIVAILSFIYALDVLFSGYVLLKSLHFPPELQFSDSELDSIDESTLPVYSILCPLYKEGRVLAEFVESMKSLEWPKNKLDVLILLEEDDEETLAAAHSLNLPDYFRIVVVPDSQPRTKPKACNYGLLLARGEYVVVFDAEDKPDPMQLKKAYLGFTKLGFSVFCLQSKLNYYNPNHNLLTRMFTAEYSLWFDVILPGLQSIDSSIPLGGTSNHFRVKDLIKIHAWDPFNVTEDCDLGVRIFKAGYKTAIIDSTTYEEANSSAKNWIRQRSRWIKGYMQTYLVHMRNPIQFFREHGIHALIFQLIIGMRMTFMLINPFLWVMTIAYFAFRSTIGVAIESIYPAPVFYTAAFALVVGNFMYIFNYMIGSAKRGHYGLIKYVFLIPIYWVMASIAAAKALHQLLFKPHFWEKTHHGLHLPKAKSQPAGFQSEIKFSRPKFSRRAIPAGALLVAAMLVANISDFTTSTYLGRSLKSESFALVALMTSFMFIAQLPSTGISQTVSHKTAFLFGKYNTPIGEVWQKYQRRIFQVSIGVSLLWLLMSPLLMRVFNSHTILPFVLFAPMWMLMMTGAASSGFLEGSLNFSRLAAVIIIGAIAKLGFSILFVTVGLSGWVYAALTLSYALSVASVFMLSRNVSNRYTKSIPSDSQLETALKFPTKFFAISLITNISTISFLSFDLLMVKLFLPASEAGKYALLVLAGRIVYIAGSLFSQFIVPFISKTHGSGSDTDRTFVKIFLATLFASGSAFVLVGPMGRFSLPLLFGDKATPILPYLTPFAFSIVLFTAAYSLVVFHQARKQYLFALTGIATAVFQAVLLILFHRSIGEVVNVMIASGAFFFFTSLLLHLLYKRAVFIASNLQDLFGLFWIKLNGIKKLPEGHLRILIYNWRDTKHAWAGGAEVYVHEMAKRWVASGHSVTVFCGNDGNSKREEQVDGMKIIRRGGFYTVYLWAFLYYIRYFRSRYDVIVESENGTPFFTPLYSNKPKLLVIHHVHQEVFRNQLSFPLSTIARFTESKLMPLFYGNVEVVAVSQSTKSDLVKAGMLSSGRSVEVVSPGVDTNVFIRTKKTKYPSFIYLGRHKAYKNIDVLIKAFKVLSQKHPTAKLTIAGEGELTLKLMRLAEELKVKSKVSFLGKVSETQKIKLLGESWAAVQPSSFEGWGITVIEANACGTPVIASKVNGLSDSVVDGSTGLLVPVRDVLAFSKAMEEIILDKPLRQRMSQAAYKWAKKHDWQDRANELMGVIESLRKAKDYTASGDLVAAQNYYYEKE